jgi:carbon monoxide dehydrogenase subunit G
VRTTVHVTVEVDIERPREAVWAFVSDITRAPEWIEEFVESHLASGGEPQVGSIVSYTIEPGPRTGTMELTEWDPPRRLAWDGPPLRSMGGGIAPRGSVELSERGAGRTHLVWDVQPALTGLTVLLKPYLQRWARRHRGADAQKLKAMLEADDG